MTRRVMTCVQAPMFNEVEATFDVDASAGRLTCVATGEPAPVLYWIQPSGKATRYSAPQTSSSDDDDDDQLGLNEAVLELDTDHGLGDPVSESAGMYICVADNDAGNATLTVSLPSPYSSLARRHDASTFTHSQPTQARLTPRTSHVLLICCQSRVAFAGKVEQSAASVRPSVCSHSTGA